MFLDETKDGSDNNFFLNDDSTDSGRMEPMVDILDDESALNIALTDQIQLASSAYIDECSIYLPSPSPSRSRNRLRTRANSDSCNSPGVVAGGARGRPRNTDDSRGNEKKWCAESQVPIPGFGNVPVCYKSGIGGLESEMFLLEPTPSTGFFQNLFTCNLSKILRYFFSSLLNLTYRTLDLGPWVPSISCNFKAIKGTTDFIIAKLLY